MHTHTHTPEHTRTHLGGSRRRDPSSRLRRRLFTDTRGRYSWGGRHIHSGLTWYRALTWHSSPARPFTAPNIPLLVTGQQGSLSPASRQLSRARNACAGGSSEGSTKLKHGAKLGRTLARHTVRAGPYGLTRVNRSGCVALPRVGVRVNP